MVVVGKYRSRRRKGGNLLSAVRKTGVVKAIETMKDVAHHPLDHQPMEILKTVEKHVTDHPEHVTQLLNDVAKDMSNVDVNSVNPIHKFTSEFPNFSGPDPYAFARSLRKTFKMDDHPKADHAKVGGGIFKSGFSEMKKFASNFNPADSVSQSFDNLDRIHMEDHSFRGIAKNAINLHSAMLHGHAAYAQASGLAMTPFTAGSSAVALGGVAMAQNKIADAETVIARRL